MPRKIIVTATYHGDADILFRSALDMAELKEAMSGLAVYEGLPDDPIAQGDTIIVDVTIWGIIRQKGYEMHVARLDPDARILQSRERGQAVRQWDHTLSIQPQGKIVEWIDSILVDAGWRTWAMARFGRYLYVRRHRRRGALHIDAQITRA